MIIIKNTLSAILASLTSLFLTIKRINFNKNCSKQVSEPEYICLWHASSRKFLAFDFTKIGANSIKYGYGIYFSREKEIAMQHALGAKYLYRVDLHKNEYEKLLKLEKPLLQHSPHIQDVAKKLSIHEPLASKNSILEASGHSLYKAACTAAGGDLTGIEYERLGTNFLIENKILGASLKEYEEIIVLYSPTLCIITDCEAL